MNGLYLANELGNEQVDAIKLDEVCVPAVEGP